MRKTTGNKPQHYDTSDAQPLAGASACAAQVPSPPASLSQPMGKTTGNSPYIGDEQGSTAPDISQLTATAPPITEGSGATATSDSQPSTAADIGQQTRDVNFRTSANKLLGQVTPLAEEPGGLPFPTIHRPTGDAIPLATEPIGLPLYRIHRPSEGAEAFLDMLTIEAESDVHSEAVDLMLQHLHD